MDKDHILAAMVVGRPISNLDRQRLKSAITVITSILGEGFFSEPRNGDADGIGRVVSVPGDQARWIVFHENGDDGTCDLIRESSINSMGILTGWVPGQSLSEYYKALEAVKLDPLEKEESAISPELRTPISSQKQKKGGRKPKLSIVDDEKSSSPVQGVDFYGESVPEEDE